ncbi:MAG: LLM class flavin-dependent oxidoreductase [Pseudonocardia sp.]
MRPFRFGVVAVPQPATWLDQARRIADLGYTSLLMPDGVALPAPFPSLAMAAAVTDLTVGTYVLAASLRPSRSAAWEAHTMTQLTGGRFEFGIGTGLPRTREGAESFGLPFRSAAERLADVELAITHLRELDGDTHTPVLMAVRGPKARALAARLADVVTPALPALTPRAEVAALVADVREQAGRDLEFSINLFVVGNGPLPPWAAQNLGASVDELVAAGSIMLLPGASPRAMADELLRRRDTLGISYVKINSMYLEEMAPVVELLSGT